MYHRTVQKGPSKIAAITRRSNPRTFDVPENSRDQSEKVDPEDTMSAPAKPVFSHSHNNKSRNQSRVNNSGPMSAHHQEAANFLAETWNRAMREYDKCKSSEGGPEWYRPREVNPHIENFKKFDLDLFLLQRTVQQLTEPN